MATGGIEFMEVKNKIVEQLLESELFSGMVQVELVEDGVAPVTGHRLPVFATVVGTLCKEPAQVGALSQAVAVDGFVNTVAAHLIVAVAHGGDVDALTRFKADVPVVAGHAGDDMVVSEMPGRGHV